MPRIVRDRILVPGPSGASLGYTPVNKAGDTMTGQLAITSNEILPLLRLRNNGTGNYIEVRNSTDAIVMRLLNNTRLAVGHASVPVAQLHVQGEGAGAAVPTAVLQAIASQSANLLELRDSAGAVMTSINNGGRMTIDSGASSGTNLTLIRNHADSANVLRIQSLFPGGRANISWYDDLGNPIVYMSAHGDGAQGHIVGTPYHIEWYTAKADKVTMLPRFDIKSGEDWVDVSVFNAQFMAAGHDVTKTGLIVRRGTAGLELVELNRPQADALGSNRVYRNLDALETAGPVVAIHQDHATDDQAVLRVRQDGPGAYIEFRDATDVVKARMMGTGRWAMGSATAPTGQLQVTAQGPTVPTIIAQAVASQTANLVETRDSANAVLSGIDAAGRLLYPAGLTATTVGAAGAATALPTAPEGYLIVSIAGTLRKVPFYAA